MTKDYRKGQGPYCKIDISFFLLWTAMVGEQGTPPYGGAGDLHCEGPE
jgi:hypothetical protein